MKKRHLVKQYGPAAVILTFLLIWLGQQNAADNSIINTIPIEQQSAEYDALQRLDIGIHSLEDDRRNIRDFDETKRQAVVHRPEYRSSSRNTSTSNASVASQIIFSVQEKDRRLQPLDRTRKTHTEAGFDDEKRSGENFTVVDDLNEGVKRLPPSVTDVATKLDSQRGTDVGVVNSSVKHRGFRTSAAANVVDPSKQAIFNGIAGTGPRNVSVTSRYDLKLILTTMKSRQQVLSDKNDEYKQDSLILARQMALRNFEVITDNKEHSHVQQSANNSVSSKVSDTVPVKDRTLHNKRLPENAVPNSSVDSGRKQELDELRKFADVPTLPEYDLPMLKEKSADAKRSTSKVLSELVSDGILPTVSNLVVNNTADGGGVGSVNFDDEVLADTDDVMSNAVVLGEVNPNR